MTTTVVLIYIACAIVGYFCVAFLGFAYNLDEIAIYTEPLLRPDWVNLTTTHRMGHTVGSGPSTGGRLWINPHVKYSVS